MLKTLQEIRALIEIGWAQGFFAQLPNGDYCFYDEFRACRFCLYGAILRVNMSKPGHMEAVLNLLKKILDIETTSQFSTSQLSSWNDAPERTKEEVLALLDLAIEEVHGQIKNSHQQPIATPSTDQSNPESAPSL